MINEAVPDYIEAAANLIAHFEGFISTAKWDVNAYRVGYGSDTEGPDQIKVMEGTTTTRERALQNLAARIPQYAQTIIKQVGQEAYNKLGFCTKCALLDFAYNYGSLTTSLIEAVKSNEGVSTAIAARETDNRGVNAKRRYAEAVIVSIDGV